MSKKPESYNPKNNTENIKKIANFYYFFILIFIALSGIWPLFFIAIFAKQFIFKFLEKNINQKNINNTEINNIKFDSISDILKSIPAVFNNAYIKNDNQVQPDDAQDINKDYKYIPKDANIQTTVQSDTGRSFLTIGVFIFLVFLLISYYTLKNLGLL